MVSQPAVQRLWIETSNFELGRAILNNVNNVFFGKILYYNHNVSLHPVVPGNY